MKRWIKALSLGLVCTFLVSLCGFSANCEQLRDQVLRLHILANSDSAADQQLNYRQSCEDRHNHGQRTGNRRGV